MSRAGVQAGQSHFKVTGSGHGSMKTITYLGNRPAAPRNGIVGADKSCQADRGRWLPVQKIALQAYPRTDLADVDPRHLESAALPPHVPGTMANARSRYGPGPRTLRVLVMGPPAPKGHSSVSTATPVHQGASAALAWGRHGIRVARLEPQVFPLGGKMNHTLNPGAGLG